jgi:hypothetical protein
MTAYLLTIWFAFGAVGQGEARSAAQCWVMVAKMVAAGRKDEAAGARFPILSVRCEPIGEGV